MSEPNMMAGKGKPNREFTKYPEMKALWIGLFADVLGFFILVPYFPALIHAFDSNAFIIGLILATNALFTLIFAPIWGKISDKIGRKPVLLISQMGTFTGFILLAVTNSIEMLLIARIIDGVFGGNFPMVKAIISDAIPPKDRGRQMTNVGVVMVTAGVLGPGLAGLLSFFEILGPTYPLASAGFFAAALSFISIMNTTLKIHETWPKEKREHYEKQDKTKLKLRKNKDASYLLTQYVFHSFSFIMFISTITLFLGIIMGLDTFGISILMSISGITRAIVRFTLFNPTMKLLGEVRMTRMGLFILVVTFFLSGFIRDIISFTILMIFMSYGVSCCRGLLIGKITQTVSPKEMGKINGITTTIDSLAQIFGLVVGSFILYTMESYWLGIIMSLIGLVAFLMVFKKITPYMQKMQMMQKEGIETE